MLRRTPEVLVPPRLRGLPYGLGVAGAAIAAVTCGWWAANLDPSLVIVGGVAALILLLTVVAYGATGVAALLLLGVGLLPVVAQTNVENTTVEILGQEATTVRIALLIFLTIAGSVALGDKFAVDLPKSISRLMLALFATGVLGVGVAIAAPYPDPTGILSGISHAAGQPIGYALVLGLFVSVLQHDPRGRARLLRVWCFAVLAEGALVAVQLKTGAAYDPIRHFTRPYGTMGSDFLAAFSVLGAFAALAFRAGSTRRSDRHLATAALVTAVLTLTLSIARASILGFAVAATFYLLMSLKKSASRRRIGAILAVGILCGGALFALQGFWAARLDAPATESFDRPATWSSGLRMAADHPLTGVGSTSAQLVEALERNPRYRETEFGVAGSIPHNSWIIAFGGSGIFYGALFVVVTGLFILVFRGGSRSVENRFLLAGALGTGVTYLSNTMFNHPEVTIFMLLAAALVATSPERGRPPLVRSG